MKQLLKCRHTSAEKSIAIPPLRISRRIKCVHFLNSYSAIVSGPFKDIWPALEIRQLAIHIAVGLAVCPTFAQQLPFQRAQEPLTLLPQNATSDSSAVAAMQAVLKRLGGASAWTTIRSAETHATIFSLDGKKSVPLYLLDDWSTDVTKFRRRLPASSQKPVDHIGTPARMVHTPNGDKAMPEFDQARVLLEHLPGAAIEIMLRKPEYIFKSGSNGRCGPSEQCVDVYRKGQNGLIVKEQEWTISAATDLPSCVRYTSPNILGPSTQTWQRIDFDGFRSVGNVVVPSQVDLGAPNGSHARLSYRVPTFNLQYDTSAFDAEGLQ